MTTELLTQIAEVLPPPEEPDGLNRSWQTVESELGLGLPNDYKQFIDRYGSGCILAADAEGASIISYNLRGVPDVVGWVSAAARRYDDDRKAGYQHPFAPYPQAGGLLAWATTPNGDFFNWRTEGEPSDWDIVFYDCSSAPMILLEGQDFARVLFDLLRQESSLMPRPIPVEDFAPPCRFTEEIW